MSPALGVGDEAYRILPAVTESMSAKVGGASRFSPRQKYQPKQHTSVAIHVLHEMLR